jgi:biopolymer transport protein TolR
MAYSSGDGSEDEITGINVTPLVDVMLVLLIIFMVTANYIAHQAIAVKLPKAETSDSVEKSKNFAFVLDEKSQLYFNGEALSWEQLGGKIDEERARSPTATLNALISADKATPHGAVVKLIDTVRKHGITDFAIDIEKGAED